MLHTNIKVNFRDYKPSDGLIYEFSSYKNKLDMLCSFIRAHYEQDYREWNSEQFKLSYDQYQKMITEAIKSDDLDSLEVLWQGIYFHDRANPDYESDVYTAVEFGNIKTLQHVLYAYMNYNTLDCVEPLEYTKLLELATKNKNIEILNLINELKCVTDNDEIHYLMTEFDSEDSEDHKDKEQKQKLFLEIINKYT
jgi:hypothetical protein